MVQEVFGFDIIGDLRCTKPRYVIYVIGQADGHMMDWRGCNFQRCKAPNQPKFTSLKEATAWAVAHYKEYASAAYGINGSHISDYNDTFDEKVLMHGSDIGAGPGDASCYIGNDGEMSEELWDEYRDMAGGL